MRAGALVFEVAPLVVPDAVDCAGAEALAGAEATGAGAGAADTAGGGGAGAAVPLAVAAGAGATDEAPGAGGVAGVPKPAGVHAQARPTPTTATPSTDIIANAVMRIRFCIYTTPI